MKISDISNETLMQFIGEIHGDAMLDKIVRQMSAAYITMRLCDGAKNTYAFLQPSPEVAEVVVYYRDALGKDRNITSKFELFMDGLEQNHQEEPEMEE